MVQAYAFRHSGDVDPELLAQIGDHVYERDLGCEESIGGVLDQLRGLDVGDDLWTSKVVAVQVQHQRAGLLGVGADDDSVRVQKIVDRGTLAKKLRVAGDLIAACRRREPP